MIQAEIEGKIRGLTSGWLDPTGHLIEDGLSYVGFGRSAVTLDGDFTQQQVRKMIQVLEMIEILHGKEAGPGAAGEGDGRGQERA